MSNNNSTNQNLVTAVRTVGQLLLHRSTSGVMCRDANGIEVDINSMQGATFCYVGACKLVDALVIGTDLSDIFAESPVWDACDKVLGHTIEGDSWDTAPSRTRKRWATRLANYTGE